MTTSIRAATQADAGALASLSRQLGYPAEAGDISRRLEEIVEHRSGAVLVAEDDGGVAGWAEASLQRHLVHDARAELAGLVVAEGARNRGVGVALLRAVEAWARDCGLREMIVRSNVVRERAHHFYLREGYSEEKRQAVFCKRL
ncbi:MAG TPA: GNAT family N-acetyltransferase [Rhodanobacteraceae bacterium]|nr:GNAT family N-acetyltransferase [Rhodanobacteraceae bacterium]